MEDRRALQLNTRIQFFAMNLVPQSRSVSLGHSRNSGSVNQILTDANDVGTAECFLLIIQGFFIYVLSVRYYYNSFYQWYKFVCFIY